jgi:hypothetical protein
MMTPSQYVQTALLTATLAGCAGTPREEGMNYDAQRALAAQEIGYDETCAGQDYFERHNSDNTELADMITDRRKIVEDAGCTEASGMDWACGSGRDNNPQAGGVARITTRVNCPD